MSKSKLAIAVLVVVMLVPATAWATHVFDDVADEKFYADAATWAKTNDITTGSPAGSKTFKPDDNVTRGETVTFMKRYDDNIVQPALDAIEAGPNVAAFATVLADGSVVAARSSGVADANVSLDSDSAFCFSDLEFEFTSVQVGPLYVGNEDMTTTEVGYPDTTGFGLGADCGDASAELEIATLADGTWTPRGFTVTFIN